jgi:hypothetical protein
MDLTIAINRINLSLYIIEHKQARICSSQEKKTQIDFFSLLSKNIKSHKNQKLSLLCSICGVLVNSDWFQFHRIPKKKKKKEKPKGLELSSLDVSSLHC